MLPGPANCHRSKYPISSLPKFEVRSDTVHRPFAACDKFRCLDRHHQSDPRINGTRRHLLKVEKVGRLFARRRICYHRAMFGFLHVILGKIVLGFMSVALFFGAATTSPQQATQPPVDTSISSHITQVQDTPPAVIIKKAPTPSATTQTPRAILCNGAYYSSCGIGIDFVCPTGGGKAYCQPRASAQSVAPIEQNKTYFENGEYVSLTDAEHTALLQQKQTTLQQLQSQLQPYLDGDQQAEAAINAACPNLASPVVQGRDAAMAQNQAAQCSADVQSQRMIIQANGLMEAQIEQQIQQVQDNYQ
jgi:hypothetical protein